MNRQNTFLIRPRERENSDSYVGYSEEELVRLLNALDVQRDVVAHAIEKRRDRCERPPLRKVA